MCINWSYCISSCGQPLTWTEKQKTSLNSITMMTSSNGNIFRVTGHLCGEFTGLREFPTQRPVTRSFDVFFYLRPNKRLSKQSWGWWLKTPSRPLWRHRNDIKFVNSYITSKVITEVTCRTNTADHQQAWYWPCMTNRSLSYTMKDFLYLPHLSTEQWREFQYDFLTKIPIENNLLILFFWFDGR